MMHPLHFHIETLLRQGKTDDAIKRLQSHLSEYPEDEQAKYLLAFSYYLTGRLQEARTAAEVLFSSDPEQAHLVSLLAEIDIAEDKYEDAESKARFLVSLDPNHANAYILLGRVKYLQGYYDAALMQINQALKLDPESREALNLKVRISDTVGQYDQARESISELLNLDPENPTTLANLGIQMLNEGKVSEALEVFRRALSIQPTNMLARHGMMEALKSRFWIYRLFYQYQKMMSRLSAKNSWMVIIGTYIVARILGGIADVSDGVLQSVLNVVVILIAITFFLSWVINPLLNLVLSKNKYGKLLLDDREKKMATLTGISLLVAIICFIGYFVTSYYRLLLAGLIFVGLMIPAGTWLNPDKEDKQLKLRNFGGAILVAGLVAIAFGGGPFLVLSLIGLLGYQFYFNKMMISDFSRKFEK